MKLTKKSLSKLSTALIASLILQAMLATGAQAQANEPLLEERQLILEQVDKQSSRLDELTLQLAGKSGEEYLVILGQIGRLESDILELYDELADNVDASQAAGVDTRELQTFYDSQMVPATEYLIHLIEVTQRETQLLGQQRESIPRPELGLRTAPGGLPQAH